MATSVRIINNSSTILPHTRVDLHTVFTANDIISSFDVACTQLQHTAYTIFSDSRHWKTISGVLHKFNVPLLSTELPTRFERETNPFTVFLGPDKEDLTDAVAATVNVVSKKKIVVITHNSNVLIFDRLIESLQKNGKSVTIEKLEDEDIKPNLVRVRQTNIKCIIVDISD